MSEDKNYLGYYKCIMRNWISLVLFDFNIEDPLNYFKMMLAIPIELHPDAVIRVLADMKLSALKDPSATPNMLRIFAYYENQVKDIANIHGPVFDRDIFISEDDYGETLMYYFYFLAGHVLSEYDDEKALNLLKDELKPHIRDNLRIVRLAVLSVIKAPIESQKELRANFLATDFMLYLDDIQSNKVRID